MNETGLSNLSVEILHSLLLLIQQYFVKQPTKSIINNEEFEKFLDLLRKGLLISYSTQNLFIRCFSLSEYPKERVTANGSIILLPLLYPSNTSSTDIPSNHLLTDLKNLSISGVKTTLFSLVFNWISFLIKGQMDNNLADMILEMGYNFTSSVENCRNALMHFGLQEIKPSTIARMISAMIKTHTGLTEHTQIYVCHQKHHQF